MTDPSGDRGRPDAQDRSTSAADEERRRRIEQLQRRRSPRNAPAPGFVQGPAPRSRAGVAPSPLPPPTGSAVVDERVATMPLPITPSPRTGSSRTTRRRRPHPAVRARIGAAGLGVAAMCGLVAVMGFSRASTAADPVPAPTSAPTGTPGAAPSHVLVVIHRNAAEPAATTATSAPTETAVPPTVPRGPIELAPRPVVRPAPPPRAATGQGSTRSATAQAPAAAPAPQPAPAARTSGSN